MCGRVVNTSNFGSGGPGFKPRPSRSLDGELYCTLAKAWLHRFTLVRLVRQFRMRKQLVCEQAHHL